MNSLNRVHFGDCRESMRAMIAAGVKVNCIVTSPPYWGLRDYGTATWRGGDSSCAHTGAGRYYTEQTAASCSGDAFSGPGEKNAERLRKGRWRESGVCTKCGAEHSDEQLGLESTPQEYVANMVEVFRLARDLLADDGTCWINLGDSYTSGGRKERDPGQSKIHPAYEGEAFADGLRPGTPAGLKPKDLVGIPWRTAFALQADGWYLRQDIIWHKPNPMPESVRDRCTKSHEYIFMLSKNARYYYDADAIAEPMVSGDMRRPYAPGQVDVRGNGHDRGGGELRKQDGTGNRRTTGFNARYFGSDKPYTGKATKDYEAGGAQDASATKARIVDRILSGDITTRNKRSVWTVTTKPFKGAHFATFPPDLIEPCIMAGCPVGGIVLDPFMGSGTTAQVAQALGRQWIGCELQMEYESLQKARTAQLGMAL